MFSFEFGKTFKDAFLQYTSDRMLLQISFFIRYNKDSFKNCAMQKF